MRGRPTWTVAALAGMACAGLGDNFKEPNIQLDHAVVRGVGLAGGAHTVVSFTHESRARLTRPSATAGST